MTTHRRDLLPDNDLILIPTPGADELHGRFGANIRGPGN
jgi:hypothetical protein